MNNTTAGIAKVLGAVITVMLVITLMSVIVLVIAGHAHGDTIQVAASLFPQRGHGHH